MPPVVLIAEGRIAVEFLERAADWAAEVYRESVADMVRIHQYATRTDGRSLAFYLATHPAVFVSILAGLSTSGLVRLAGANRVWSRRAADDLISAQGGGAWLDATDLVEAKARL